MKSILILLTCLLSLSFYSCGETEDTDIPHRTAVIKAHIPTNTPDTLTNLPWVSTDAPTDTTWVSTDVPWFNLSDDYVAELKQLEVPLDFAEIEDPKLHRKYHHVLLLKLYGDISQVRTIIEYELNRLNWGPVFTFKNSDEYIPYLNKTIAYREALLFLWPNEEATQKALENTKRTKQELEDGGIKGN